jgi:hypothetical protein
MVVGLSLTTVLSTFGATICSAAFSDKQLLKDYQSYVDKKNLPSPYGCKEYLKFTNVKKLRKSEEKKVATIIVNVTADWVASGDPGFFGGACGYFRESNGANQTLEKKMIYKKYDNGWHLETIDTSN